MKKLILNLLFSAALLGSTTLVAGAEQAEQKPAASGVVPAAPAEAAAPAPVTQAPLQAKPGSQAGKAARSKSLDLRHCLELETNAAIIKCAE